MNTIDKTNEENKMITKIVGAFKFLAFGLLVGGVTLSSAAGQVSPELRDFQPPIAFELPSHEGIYKITSSTKDENVLNIDKIVVLESSSQKKLIVNFINSKFNRVVFSYTDAILEGNKIFGKSMSSSTMSSQFELFFDRDSGQVHGVILTTRTKQITFKAERSFAVEEIFKGEAPANISDKDVLGEMEGSIMGINGTLSIHSFVPGVYSASFISERGELKIDYQGKFFPKEGAISLTHENKSKLVIALRKIDNEAIWRGASFSVTNGKAIKAMFNPLFDLDF